MFDTTIAAIATSLTPSGISIIRISGKDSFKVIDKIFRGKNHPLSKAPSHTINYGHIYDGDKLVDEVLVSIFRAPRSYTAEDTVEINCHGGILITKMILALVLKNGATLAEPGEFTKRAFLNGRIDLSKAEAVSELITAKNYLSLQSSTAILKGSLYEKISEMRAEILNKCAFIEAALDDPEHYDFNEHIPELENIVNKLKKDIDFLIKGFDNGSILKSGINTLIIGCPNVGKSSLLNALAGNERAIVTDIEGTTRDIITETVMLDEISLNIIDTAGIRNTDDPIEKIGIEKTKEQLNICDLVIAIFDSSKDLSDNDIEILELIKDKKSILLLNKCDLEAKTTADDIKKHSDAPVINISIKQGTGIEALKDSIKNMFTSGLLNDNSTYFISNIRQKKALEEADASLDKVLSSIENDMPEDFFTIDLMAAYDSLGLIIGATGSEDLYNEIFSKFCMGK